MNRRVKSSGIVCNALAVLAVCSSALGTTSGQITATIYGGQHFEVRDHDQPTKYVFNGATRVASITGSLSANTRIQRLRLYPGWNLCSLAVSAGNALQQFNSLSASGGEGQGEVVLSAFKWNLLTQGWLSVATNDNLAAGTVLWLKARTNATVAVIGAYADPTTQQVQSEGAYVPSTGLEAWTPSFPPTLSAWLYDPETNQWHEQLDGDLAFISNLPPTLSPGQALYVQTASTVSLDIPEPALRIRYYHEDHLGSSTAITDTSGAFVEETAYYPFGVPRNEYRLRQIEKHYTFTQKERDKESGFHYFEARYLATRLSRLLTADPKYANPNMLLPADLGSFLAKPQIANLYGYASSNPIKFTDPTGLGPLDYLIYAEERKEKERQEKARPPFLKKQISNFEDHPARPSANSATWTANLQAVCQKEPGKGNYTALDSISYGFRIDARGNVTTFKTTGSSRINVTTFRAEYTPQPDGTLNAGLAIKADYTGYCEHSLQWVQTITTTSPHSGCWFFPYNDPCISDDPPGHDMPFYWTEAENASKTRTVSLWPSWLAVPTSP